MNELVRDLWVSTLHCCRKVEQAMCNLTKRESSEQHVELGSSRCSRDFDDLKKMYQWLETLNPFDVSYQQLRSLSTPELAAKEPDNMTCDKADKVGEIFQRILDKKSVLLAKVLRKMKVRPLFQLQKKSRLVLVWPRPLRG